MNKSDESNEFRVLKAVYCYMFPETWKSLEEVQDKVSRDFFLRTTKADDITRLFEPLFSPVFGFPSHSSGFLSDCLNLDELFIPVAERFVNKYKSAIQGLNSFENVFPSPGSSDVIFKTLAFLKSQGVKDLNVLRGEYEGFSISANALGMNVVEHDLNYFNEKKVKPGVWYISNPSAINGNILNEDFIKNILDNNHKVVFDFAYVGSTKPYVFDVCHENVVGVLISPSKPFGVFEERVTGFAFLRDEYFPKEKVNHFLYGNRWFTDKVRTLQALKLVNDFGPNESGVFPLQEKYVVVQNNIVNYLRDNFDLPFIASDSFLLSYIKSDDLDLEILGKEKLDLISQYKRNSDFRFCLTPYFENFERGDLK